MQRMKREQSGFTLIELVLVIVILGILGAMAIPKFVNLSDDAKDASKAGIEGTTKSAMSIYIAKNKANPTVTQLASYVDGGTAVATGVQFTIDGVNYVVKTFTDEACTTATAAVGNTVACIHGVTP